MYVVIVHRHYENDLVERLINFNVKVHPHKYHSNHKQRYSVATI